MTLLLLALLVWAVGKGAARRARPEIGVGDEPGVPLASPVVTAGEAVAGGGSEEGEAAAGGGGETGGPGAPVTSPQ